MRGTCRPAVRVPGELHILPRLRLRVPRARQVLVRDWRSGGVRLRLRHGVQCRHALLGHTAPTQLHLQLATHHSLQRGSH